MNVSLYEPRIMDLLDELHAESETIDPPLLSSR
jgi:hypothetical protein